MSSTMNKVIIVGRLGHKPELGETRDKRPYCRLNVATDEWGFNGEKLKPQWHAVQIFGDIATHACRYLDKGHSVWVEGRLNTHTYNDKDGKPQSRTYVRAKQIGFMGKNSRVSVEAPTTEAPTEMPQELGEPDPPN